MARGMALGRPSASAGAVAALAALCCAHALLEDALDVIRFGKEIGEEIINSWEVLGEPLNVSGGVELPLMRRRERELLARLASVARAIDQLQMTVERGEVLTALVARGGARRTRLELRLHELADLQGRVDASDAQMREYTLLDSQYEPRTLEDFASWCVSHDPGAVTGLLDRVHALMIPSHKHLVGRGLFHMLADNLEEESPDRCELQLSTHQIIYDMYKTVALTEIKGYAMMQFSWMLLRVYGKGNFTQEASLTRKRYDERTMKTAMAARTAMENARRDVYRCDPPHHEEGTTYAQVTRLLQGYIENEVDMNQDGTCRENCAFYTLTQRHGCYKDQFCSRQPACLGRIINCQYIDSDMWICPATWSSNRRYEYIEYENGRTFGHPGSCRRGVTKVDSWWQWWKVLHCSYCFCLCEDLAESSERFFSMRETLSDVATNKVVTGLRLIKLGRVFHLQISEGTLEPRGEVRPGEWVKVQQFDPNDHNTQEGVDYHTLTYEKRAIDLDELDSPEGHVLTGVRFRMIGAHLHFEIHTTPFNYTTGRLAAPRGQWLSNDNTEGGDQPRSALLLTRPDIPTRSKIPLKVDSKHDQYVEFTYTDLEADAAQSTVPFIDIQPVQPLKGATLASGAGLIHRGAQGSGGFIGVKLITYNYTKHVRAEPPPPQAEPEERAPDFTPVIN